MPKPKRPDHDHDHSHDHRGQEHSDRRGRDFPVFLKVRGRRWLGSAPPSAQAYAHALAQWRQLPGAIGATAADLGGPESLSANEADGKDKS
jgi:hypothetical protein